MGNAHYIQSLCRNKWNGKANHLVIGSNNLPLIPSIWQEHSPRKRNAGSADNHSQLIWTFPLRHAWYGSAWKPTSPVGWGRRLGLASGQNTDNMLRSMSSWIAGARDITAWFRFTSRSCRKAVVNTATVCCAAGPTPTSSRLIAIGESWGSCSFISLVIVQNYCVNYQRHSPWMTKPCICAHLHTFSEDWVVWVPWVCARAFTPYSHHKTQNYSLSKTEWVVPCTPFYHHTSLKTAEKKMCF